MSTRNLAWGVTGGVSFLLALACGGNKVHDVGDADDGGSGGSGGRGNVGGSADPSGGTGFDDVAGRGGVGTAGTGFDDTAGTSYGGLGTAGTNVGGFGFGGTGFDNNAGSGGMPAGCFEPANSYTYAIAPEPAPQNAVFIDAHPVASETVKNYADQVIFTNTGGPFEAYANFAASTAATDTAISLPAQLTQVAANLGQFYVVTRPNCAGMPAGGHKLTVEFWWKVGAVVDSPTHGVALGAVSNQGKAVWFADSAKTYVTGDAQTKRLMNTLSRLKVEHTFAEDDQTDASKVTLGVWLLPSAELPSSFYIGQIKWD